MPIAVMGLEKFDRRLGTVVVHKGFITAEQLVRGLELQVIEELKDWEARLIGAILTEHGHVTASQINEVDGEVMEAR